MRCEIEHITPIMFCDIKKAIFGKSLCSGKPEKYTLFFKALRNFYLDYSISSQTAILALL